MDIRNKSAEYLARTGLNTSTKVTYNSGGIIIRGGSATTDDIIETADRRFVNGSQLTALYNISGVNTGASFAYDGVDTFYISIGTLANDFIYIHALNMGTMRLDGAFQTNALQGAVHIGNLMAVISSPDGGKFLYLAACSSRLIYKTLIQ